MTHQGTVLCIYYWRVIGKADGMLKEDGIFRVREIFWEEKHGGRHYVQGKKIFREVRH
jgi:hypothetical protein